MRNQERVWKKEQEALAEQKQVDELRKQYDEARQREEVEAMAVAAGVKKCGSSLTLYLAYPLLLSDHRCAERCSWTCRKQERLDWMYQGGMVAKQEAEKRADAQMLGEKEVELQAAAEPDKVWPENTPSRTLPLDDLHQR